jgi:hypothetical protein
MTEKPMTSEMWTVEPSRKNEACVQFVLGANKAEFVSSDCNSKALLVCEVSNGLNLTMVMDVNII